MKSRNLDESFTKWMVLSAAAALILMVAAPAAQAKPEDPFEPEFTVTTSSTKAGANPDLTISVKRPQPKCPAEPDDEFPTNCDPGTIENIEQNLKKMVLSFPPGLVADANAAPYCDAVFDWYYVGATQYKGWRCSNPKPEEAQVGWLEMSITGCYHPNSEQDQCIDVGMEEYWGNGVFVMFGLWEGFGTTTDSRLPIYNERPRPGEQGRLVIPIDGWSWAEIADADIVVRKSDSGIDSVTDDMPDVLSNLYLDDGEEMGDIYAGQIFDMKMTLYGSTGADRGHPMLTNPTFCDPQTLDAELQGYEYNSLDVPIGSTDPILGYGDGKTLIPDPTPYTATDCDAIPYAPTFAASVSSDSPRAAAAFTTTITQADDEATTKKTVVTLPKGTGLNLNNTLKTCPAADLEARNCPESSRMATVEVESKLLPKPEFVEDVAPEDEVLRGNVYLTGKEGSRLTVSVLLKGFVDLRIDGTTGIEDNDTVILAFDDMPAMPSSKMTFKFEGGDKSMVTNPKKCGPATTKATFTSHSGKVSTVESTSQIKGCSAAPKPEFEVDLSNDGKGKRTAVELDLSVQDRYIKKVTFGLPRYLKFSTKRLGKAKRFGSLQMETKRGELESSLSMSKSLRAKRKKRKAIRFQTKGALNDLKVSLFKRKVGTKKVKIRTKSGKKRTLKRSVLKSRLAFKSLPKQDIKSLRVELNPTESRFLRNPKGCKKPLRFLAFVTTSDGKRHVLSQKVKLKGKGCGKKKSKKKK